MTGLISITNANAVLSQYIKFHKKNAFIFSPSDGLSLGGAAEAPDEVAVLTGLMASRYQGNGGGSASYVEGKDGRVLVWWRFAVCVLRWRCVRGGWRLAIATTHRAVGGLRHLRPNLSHAGTRARAVSMDQSALILRSTRPRM